MALNLEEVRCRWCGKAVGVVDLGEAMARQVLAAGGAVEGVRVHAGLDACGGVAALLRYAPASRRTQG
jgi:hypothetical protein